MNDAQRIAELRRLLHRANRAYYARAQPIMSDHEYDRLLKELADLEAQHPELADPNSPTRRVGGEIAGGFHTLPHAIPMLSIDNTYSEQDVRVWGERVAKALGLPAPPELIADPKIDGVALSLRYEHGALVRALTRGDGERGDDVTANVRAIRGVPLILDDSEIEPPAVLEIRGEAYIPLDEFERINEEREQAGQDLFMNPRNACAGTLKQRKPEIVARRRLGFVAHGCGAMEPADFAHSYSDLLEKILLLGIPINTGWKRCDTIDDALDAIRRYESARRRAPYAVDGVVIRVDEFHLQERLGATARSPRWCIAYKYPAQRKTTTLLEVDFLVGKTGRITPRAVMEPIALAGTTVRRASLFNFGEIRRKDLRIGDTVVVEKAGEIIPQVIEVVKEKRPRSAKKIQAPTRCPACGGPVEIEPSELEEQGERESELETARLCVNPECPAQIREKLIWFAGRGRMDIDGLGEKTIDQIRNDPDIPLERFADIFRLKDHRDELLALDRMGEKKVDNLLRSIEKAKRRGLARALGAMGIRHVGDATARALARMFPDIDALLAAQEPQLRPKTLKKEEAVSLGFPEEAKDRPSTNLGKETAPAVHAYLHSRQAKETFRALRDAGVDLTSHDFVSAKNVTSDSFFRGKRIVLTGGLESFSRADLTDLLERFGAHVSGSVSKMTDLVIAGADPGAKRDRAVELGVEIWDEETLVKKLSKHAHVESAESGLFDRR